LVDKIMKTHFRKPGPSSDDILFGRHPVLEALKAEPCRVNKLWILRGAMGGPIEDILRLARERRVVFQWVERARLEDMANGENHQGVAARSAAAAYADLEDVLAGGTPSPLVLLDGIEDPHNVGAILRSAAFFGVKAVIIPRWRSAGLSGTVMKVSAGALAKIPLVQVTNVAQTLLDLKARGYWIYGADGVGTSVREAILNDPLALVIGAEGTGLHRLVRERCDVLVGIPGSGGMESLNASCAAAVLMSELLHRKVKPAG
jgi:23S rRNA (guanosine2251-2'-O)-methyltransferase